MRKRATGDEAALEWGNEPARPPVNGAVGVARAAGWSSRSLFLDDFDFFVIDSFRVLSKSTFINPMANET